MLYEMRASESNKFMVGLDAIGSTAHPAPAKPARRKSGSKNIPSSNASNPEYGKSERISCFISIGSVTTIFPAEIGIWGNFTNKIEIRPIATNITAETTVIETI